MSLPSNPAELWQQLVVRYPLETVLQKIREQLCADLERSGCTIPGLPEKEPVLWIPELATLLRKLTTEELHALLYLIDLPEKWHANLTFSEAYYEELSEALLYRELTKVYYKLYYSTNDPL